MSDGFGGSSLLRSYFSSSGRTSASLRIASERLASGLRINSAADDAAGLALSNKLSTERTQFTQGALQANTAISVLNTASAYIEAASSVLSRIQELVTSGTSTSLSHDQRQALQVEVDELVSEHNRIVADASVNQEALFGDTGYSISVQIGETIASATIGADITTTVGTGSYSSVSTITSSLGAVTGINVADFNGDGIQDIATGSLTSSYGVGIRLGNGDGTYGAETTYATAGAIAPVSSGDVNGDGILDLIAAGGGGVSGGMYIWEGNGDGTFQAVKTIATATFTSGLNVEDFNGDGIDDIAVSTTTGNTVEIVYGNTGGSYSVGISYGMGSNAVSLAFGDVNNDGYVDMIGNSWGDNRLNIRLSNGDGTFGARTSYATDANAVASVIADVNNDGNADILMTNGPSGTYNVYLGDGSGTFGTPTTYATGAANPRLTEVADINGDGNLDFYVRDTTGGTMQFYSGNGDGTFAAGVSFAALSSGGVLADMDGDNVLDIVSRDAAGNKIAIYTGASQTLTDFETLEALESISVQTASSAVSAVSYLSSMADRVTLIQGSVAAGFATFESVVSHSSASASTLDDAISRVRDADVATEMARYVKNSILSEQQSAMFAQANKLSLERVTQLLSSLG